MMRVTPLLLVLIAGLSACQTSNRPGDADWISEVAFDLEEAVNLGGCCIGDLDPDFPGNEIAVVTAKGEIHLIRATPEGWTSRLLGEVPGEMIQCAAGDLLPDCPGDELVVVGRARGDEDTGSGGAAWILGRRDGVDFVEPLKERPALMHAVAIGDLLPDREGDELLLAGYDARPLIAWSTPKGWEFREGPELGGKAKAVAITPTGAVAALANGDLVALDRQDDGWERRLCHHFDQPLARLGTRGDEIVVCDNGGRLHRVDEQGVELLYQDADRLRGAVYGDIDGTATGTEIATAGYRGRIVVIYPQLVEGGADVAVEVGHDEGHRLHHLAAGKVGRLGTVLATCGYQGRLLVLRTIF
jgi:hypothetical protein